MNEELILGLKCLEELVKARKAPWVTCLQTQLLICYRHTVMQCNMQDCSGIRGSSAALVLGASRGTGRRSPGLSIPLPLPAVCRLHKVPDDNLFVLKQDSAAGQLYLFLSPYA